MDRNTSVLELKGVGEKTQKLFSKIDIRTVGDLLAHYPRDYEIYEDPVKISLARPGKVCAIYAAVVGIPNERRGKRLNILNVLTSRVLCSLPFLTCPF